MLLGFLPVEAAYFSLTMKLMLMRFGLFEELHSGEIYLLERAVFLLMSCSTGQRHAQSPMKQPGKQVGIRVGNFQF